MMAGSPLVSIIIPAYNSEGLIPRCLESIVSQSYKYKDVWVVDGGSNDNTIEVVKSFAARYPFINWISENDKGVYDAMNKGIQKAVGDWIYFIGCDDFLFDDRVLENLFQRADIQQMDLIYGDVQFFHSGRIYNGSYTYEKILTRGNICHQAIFYKRHLFDRLGLYDITCRIYADHDFNIRCFADKVIRKLYLSCVIAVYNEEDGLSARNKIDTVFEQKHTVYLKQYNRTLKQLFIRAIYKAKSFFGN